MDWDDAISSLNKISQFYDRNCFRDVIDQVQMARAKLTHKNYSISKEALEFLIPAGKVTDYVLESYERGYLGFLAAAAHFQLGNNERLLPELNKIYNEETALTYNHGRDPVNALIQAALWDDINRPGFSARPFWTWLNKQNNVDLTVRDFAREQIKRIDSKSKSTQVSKRWNIYALGKFPELDWEMKLLDAEHGYIKIYPKQAFPNACVSDGGLLLPTKTWFDKISIRHAHSYHPLINIKSWVRLPIGIFFGITTYTTGASIAVGGCVLDAQTKSEGHLCQLSILGGKAVMDLSPGITNYILEPDMRHWQDLPAALLVVPAGTTDIQSHRCLKNYKDQTLKQII